MKSLENQKEVSVLACWYGKFSEFHLLYKSLGRFERWLDSVERSDALTGTVILILL